MFKKMYLFTQETVNYYYYKDFFLESNLSHFEL